MRQFLQFIFILCSFLIIGSQLMAFQQLPADSLRQKRVNGIRVKLYKVQPKDSWTVISKKNKVSVAYLMAVNSGVENLKTGQIINIPIEEGTPLKQEAEITLTEKSEPSPTLTNGSKYEVPVYHTVKKGETLYKVSKSYNQSVENLKRWNELKGNDIKTGQKLVVAHVFKYKKDSDPDKTGKAIRTDSPSGTLKTGNPPVNPLEETGQQANATVYTKPATPAGDKLIANSDSKTPVVEPSRNLMTENVKPNKGNVIRHITETGVAAWIMDGEINQNKYYALHRTAPMGTIIKVTNRMNGKSVFVKVVGVLPDTGDNENLILKISQAASSKINVLDSRFQAELSFGIAE